MDPSRGDSRYNLNYSMSSIGLSLADQADLYGNPAAAAALGGRPPSGGLIQSMGNNGGMQTTGRSSGGLMSNANQCQSLSGTGSVGSANSGQSRGIKRTNSDCYDDHHRGGGGGSGGMTSQSLQGLESCAGVGGSGGNGTNPGQQQQGNVPDVVDDNYTSLQNKKSPPANGKKTKGRVKIKMEYIDNKLRRYTTFSKRKTGIMKKAYELSTLTGTQVMLLVASETGHVYTFATRKLQPMITSEAGKQLIQTCLNSPDPPSVGGGDQRMSATGFEETELSYNIADEDSKDDRSPITSGNETDDSSDIESPDLPNMKNNQNMINASSSSGRENTELHRLNVPTMLTSTSSPPSKTTILINNSNDSEKSSILTARGSKLQTTSNSIYYHQEQEQASTSNNQNTENSFVYPASALSSLPQEVLLNLIQSGHLQLHTEEDGSGHQYITIPLSVATATNNESGCNNYSTEIISRKGNEVGRVNSIINASSTSSTTIAATTTTTIASNDNKNIIIPSSLRQRRHFDQNNSKKYSAIEMPTENEEQFIQIKQEILDQ